MWYRVPAILTLGVCLMAAQPGLAQASDGDDSPYFEIMGTPGMMVVRDRPGGRITSRLEPGTILHNLGCEPFAGRDWCEVEVVADTSIRGYAARTNLRVRPEPEF